MSATEPSPSTIGTAGASSNGVSRIEHGFELIIFASRWIQQTGQGSRWSQPPGFRCPHCCSVESARGNPKRRTDQEQQYQGGYLREQRVRLV